MPSVRILDIASEAGVSRSLVSKVLSGRMGTSTVRPEVDVVTYSNPLFMSGAMEYSSTPALDWEWSMAKYESELASRIRRIAQARGFVPNAAARSLHSGRQDCIAVFLSRHGT